MNKAVLSTSLLLLTMVSSAQTLKRHTEPPQLHPQSCVDRIAMTRHTFIESAASSSDHDYRKDAVRLYYDLQDIRVRRNICSTHMGENNYELQLALADFILRTNLVAATQDNNR